MKQRFSGMVSGVVGVLLSAALATVGYGVVFRGDQQGPEKEASSSGVLKYTIVLRSDATAQQKAMIVALPRVVVLREFEAGASRRSELVVTASKAAMDEIRALDFVEQVIMGEAEVGPPTPVHIPIGLEPSPPSAEEQDRRERITDDTYLPGPRQKEKNPASAPAPAGLTPSSPRGLP